MIVLNFSDDDAVVDTPFPLDSRWEDLLAPLDGTAPPWAVEVAGFRAAIPVGSHWGRVLWRPVSLP